MNPVIHRFLTDIAFISNGAAVALFQPLDPKLAEHPNYVRMRDTLKPQPQMLDGGIAVLPIDGVLGRKPDVIEMLYYGMEDSVAIQDMIEAADANPDVNGILLNIDSPGGFNMGGPEIANAIASASKPTVTWTGGLMASLGYMIGSQAAEVIASSSAIVGSIGVWTSHVDYSRLLANAGIQVEIFRNAEGKYKAPGLMGEALNSDQRANIQGDVQAAFDNFRSIVTTARPEVKDASMQGQCFSGQSAVDAGIVDRIGSYGYAISVLRGML